MEDESERRVFGGGNSSFVADTIIQVRNAVREKTGMGF